MTDPVLWIDILSDPAITLASRAWQKGKAETWGILSRAIKAGYIEHRMTPYQFQVHIKLTADPQYFNACPVCKTATRMTDISCTNCQVDLRIARRRAIEEEFNQYTDSPPPSAPIAISSPIQATPPHKPSQLAISLLWLGRFIYAVGGTLALLYSLYVVGFLFGWVNAVVALIIFPATYFLLPFYTLFMYGDLTLLIANYGVGITAFLLSYIANRIDPKIE
jgi:hypothetical protein